MSSDQQQKLSILIITLNEEKNLQALLPQLDFGDEILIIDSHSTDHSRQIAQAFPKLRFISREFDDFTSQRNFALSMAINPWILFLDADERLTPELKQEIQYYLSTKPDCSAYYFKRIFMFENRILRYSGNQTDKIIRLFNKNAAQYDPNKLVHEKLIVKGEIGILKNKLLHYSYNSYIDYKKKIIQYGKFKAQEQYRKKRKSGLLSPLLHPLYNFLYNYFIRLGILDGRKGILICYLNAYAIRVRYMELKRLWLQR